MNSAEVAGRRSQVMPVDGMFSPSSLSSTSAFRGATQVPSRSFQLTNALPSSGFLSRISRNFELQFCLQRLLDAVLTAHCLPLCNQPTCPSACSMNFAMAMCIVTCQVPQRAVQNCLSVDSLVIVPSSQVFRASASALMPSIAPWLTSSEFSG